MRQEVLCLKGVTRMQKAGVHLQDINLRLFKGELVALLGLHMMQEKFYFMERLHRKVMRVKSCIFLEMEDTLIVWMKWKIYS